MTNKDLLRQYVDTGLKLTEYQVKSLPINLLKTYIRKRLISIEQDNGGIEEYEFNVIPVEYKIQYLKKVLDIVKEDGRRPPFLLLLSIKKSRLEEWELNQLGKYLGDDVLKKYFLLLIKKSGSSINSFDYSLFEYEFNKIGEVLGKQYQKKYIINRTLKGDAIEEWEFNTLDFNEKVKYVKSVIDKHLFAGSQKFIEDFYVEHMGGDRHRHKQNGRDWDVPRPPEEINQVYESVKRHREILGYNK